MTRLQGLGPDLARRFRSGRACTDFAHTGGDGPYARFEIIHTPADLARWLGVIVELDGIEPGPSDLVDGRTLRRAIWNAARQVIAGEPILANDRDVINEAAARTPPAPMLDESGRSGTRRPVGASQVLSMLARDAVDLFGGPFAGHVRTCAAPDCGLLFVDRSRTGNRQWCSMQRCGTRAKVRAHRERRS